MSVKFNQSRHQFSDSITQHRTPPQGVTEWFFFNYLFIFTYTGSSYLTKVRYQFQGVIQEQDISG